MGQQEGTPFSQLLDPLLLRREWLGKPKLRERDFSSEEWEVGEALESLRGENQGEELLTMMKDRGKRVDFRGQVAV